MNKLCKLLLGVFFCIFNSCCVSRISETEQAFDRIAELHATNLYSKYQLKMNMIGGGGSEGKFTQLDIGFNKNGLLTLEQARYLYVEGLSEFLSLVNSQEMQPYLSEIPFGLDCIHYKVGASASNGSRPVYQDVNSFNGQVSYVVNSGSDLRYMIFTECDRLPQEIHRETFEEAKRIVESKKND